MLPLIKEPVSHNIRAEQILMQFAKMCSIRDLKEQEEAFYQVRLNALNYLYIEMDQDM